MFFLRIIFIIFSIFFAYFFLLYLYHNTRFFSTIFEVFLKFLYTVKSAISSAFPDLYSISFLCLFFMFFSCVFPQFLHIFSHMFFIVVLHCQISLWFQCCYWHNIYAIWSSISSIRKPTYYAKN